MIEDNIEELKNLFTEDAIGSYDDNELVCMLFVDGCSLLHYMENIDHHHPEALKIKLDQLIYIWRDTLLLENQLPRRLLEMLSKQQGADLPYLFYNHFVKGEGKGDGVIGVLLENTKPIHILDFFRSFHLSSNTNVVYHPDRDHLLGDENEQNPVVKVDDKMDPKQLNVGWNTYKNIRDLRMRGIRLMANKSDVWQWSNISFTSKWFSGELFLPVIVFSDATPYLFRNLVAYEMCPDVHCNYECCSFFSFMDSLIDTAEDVKELRLAGVFQNLFGSYEELAKFLNELGDDLPTKLFTHTYLNDDAVAYSKKFILLKLQIEKHHKNKCKTWLAQAYNAHFNSSWTMITFFAALLALVLMFIQTWFAVHPK